MLTIIFFSIFSLTTILGFGYLVSSFFERKNFDYREIDFVFFSGLFFVGLLSLILNFFKPIGALSLIFVLIGSIIFFIYIKKKIFSLFFIKIYLVVIYFNSFLLVLSQNTVDFPMYHLPYLASLVNEKISFGLANLHFRFAHTSLLQNISAMFFFKTLNVESFTIIPALIYSMTILLLIKKIIYYKKIQEYFLLPLTGLILGFVLLRFYRFNDFGNDVPSHLIVFYAFIIFLEILILKKNSKRNIFLLIILTLTSFLFKLSYGPLIFLPLILILINRITFLQVFNYKNLIFFSIFLFFFLTKNLIISGCLIYPVKFTCVKELAWYPKNYSDHAFIEKRKFEIKYRSRGYSDYVRKNNIDKKLSREEYIKDFNWIPTWLENNFLKKTLKNIFIYLFLIFLSMLISYKYFISVNRKKEIGKTDFYLVSLCLFLGLIFWFFTAPNFRYGVSYIFMPIIFYISYYIKERPEFIKNFLKTLILISFTYFSFYNLIRISKSNISQNIIFSNNDYYNNKVDYKKIRSNDHSILIPINNDVCWFTKIHCTHFEDAVNKINLKIIKSYKFYLVN